MSVDMAQVLAVVGVGVRKDKAVRFGSVVARVFVVALHIRVEKRVRGSWQSAITDSSSNISMPE